MRGPRRTVGALESVAHAAGTNFGDVEQLLCAGRLPQAIESDALSDQTPQETCHRGGADDPADSILV